MHDALMGGRPAAGAAMSESFFSRAVGGLLAIAFALVMGISVAAVLIPSSAGVARVMSDQERQLVILTGLAGGIAALLAWMVQKFAASRGFLIRFVYALLIYVLMFVALGGLLRAGYNYATKSGQDWSVGGMYGATVNQFYSFALDFVMQPVPALGALLLAAGFYIAIFGPRLRRA